MLWNGVTKNIQYLKNPDHLPLDSFSSIRTFIDEDSVFVTGSWDGSVRIYQIIVNSRGLEDFRQLACFHFEMPVTSVDWGRDKSKVYVGLLNGSISTLNTQTGETGSSINAGGPIIDMFYFRNLSSLFSVTTNGIISKISSINSRPETVKIPDSIMCCCEKQGYIVLAINESLVGFLNVDRFSKEYIIEKSHELKSKPVSILINDEMTAMFIGGLNDRILVYSISISSHNTINTSLSFSFIRFDNPGVKTGLFHQINSLVSFSVHNEVMLAIGSSGTTFKIININQRKEITIIDMSLPVTKIALSKSTNCLIVGVGNDWSKGVYTGSEINSPASLGIVFGIY